jgi:hypothetical protein
VAVGCGLVVFVAVGCGRAVFVEVGTGCEVPVAVGGELVAVEDAGTSVAMGWVDVPLASLMTVSLAVASDCCESVDF